MCTHLNSYSVTVWIFIILFSKGPASKLQKCLCPFKKSYRSTTFIVLGNGGGLITIKSSNFPRAPSHEPSEDQDILTLDDLKNHEEHIEKISRLLGKILILFRFFIKKIVSFWDLKRFIYFRRCLAGHNGRNHFPQISRTMQIHAKRCWFAQKFTTSGTTSSSFFGFY